MRILARHELLIDRVQAGDYSRAAGGVTRAEIVEDLLDSAGILRTSAQRRLLRRR